MEELNKIHKNLLSKGIKIFSVEIGGSTEYVLILNSEPILKVKDNDLYVYDENGESVKLIK